MKTTKTTKYFRHKNMYGVIKKKKDFYLLFLVTGVFIGKIARTLESDLAFEKKDWQFFSTQRCRAEFLAQKNKEGENGLSQKI